MSLTGKKKKESSPVTPLKKRRASWSELWLNHHHSLSSSPSIDFSSKLQSLTPTIPKSKTLLSLPDLTLLLPDLTLLSIISKVPLSHRKTLSLVCKRWLRLHGGLVRSVKVSDWEFLASGRLITRFPNLDSVDLFSGCSVPSSGCVLVSHRVVSSFTVGVESYNSLSFFEENLLSVETVDRGLRTLTSSLRKLVVANCSELGLLSVAEACCRLQELELHKCSDTVLLGVGAFENLQILRLVGSVDGLYSNENSLVSDIGLMILAQGCKRLVKLELVGCGGGFNGVKEIGECCSMLEELTVCDHKMEEGWLGGIGYCENLKTLKLVSCKNIDLDPGGLGECSVVPALERLHLEKCRLRDKNSVKALFEMCEAAREIVFKDCWGLDNDVFSLAMAFGRVKLLCLEGCSLLTTSGLESVILQWHELEHLKVVSCKNVKDSEISPLMSALFSDLVELQWRPDTRSHLFSSLAGAGVGGKGAKFFKKT